MLDIAFRRPPNFAPGASYEYNNTNYVLLGLVAEKAGGHPLAQQFRDRLFAPLELVETSLPSAADLSLPTPYSHGYMYGGSAYAMVDRPYPADVQAAVIWTNLTLSPGGRTTAQALLPTVLNQIYAGLSLPTAAD